MASTDTTTPGTNTEAMAAQYEALTQRCGLVDRSERGKLALTGADAVEFMNGQVTNELLDLLPGQGRYAAFLTHKGKMLGDLRILAVGRETAGDATPTRSNNATAAHSDEAIPTRSDEAAGGVCELLLDTERVALQSLFDMIRRFKVGYRVDLHKRTLESALLSLVGPVADRVAAAALDPPKRIHDSSTHDPGTRDSAIHDTAALPAEAEHTHTTVEIAGTPARLIRTDIGIDVLFSTGALATVSEALQAAGAIPVSEQAAEVVRVEHGRPRYGIDIDESTIPQEAGLNERAVSFTKGCYVGQETVARLHYKGKPNRHLRGLRLPPEPPAAIEPGTELKLGERPVGRLGSSVLSPRLGAIGLALLRREAEPGATVAVADSGAEATVVELPFE